MSYIDGFVVPVPAGKKQAYREVAAKAAQLLKECGANRIVECWGDDVPDGKVTDFRRAVQAEEGEVIVFSWIVWPSKAVRDAGHKKMMDDARMKMDDMPFDGKRMIFGGFKPFVEEGTVTGGYVDGFVLPVPNDKRDAYRDLAAKAAKLFQEHGAIRDIEAWADDVPKGEVTDFYRAVKAKDDETIVFSFIEWPDKATRDEGWKKVMADERMKPDKEGMPFDGQRMFWGGFQPIVDETKREVAQRSPAAAQPA